MLFVNRWNELGILVESGPSLGNSQHSQRTQGLSVGIRFYTPVTDLKELNLHPNSLGI